MAIRHGGHGTLTYSRWKAMMQRCRDAHQSNYRKYGARGIKVCERWQSYPNFLADMGVCPSRSMTLDRIDNAIGYQPGNCRWVTKAEQARNRPSHCVTLTHNGRTMIVTEWARRVRLKPHTIYARIRLGWSPKRILTTPADGSPEANRHPNLRMLTHCGETKPLIEWAKIVGISPNTLRMRLRLGWSVEKALTR